MFNQHKREFQKELNKCVHPQIQSNYYWMHTEKPESRVKTTENKTQNKKEIRKISTLIKNRFVLQKNKEKRAKIEQAQKEKEEKDQADKTLIEVIMSNSEENIIKKFKEIKKHTNYIAKIQRGRFDKFVKANKVIDKRNSLFRNNYEVDTTDKKKRESNDVKKNDKFP